jgi:DNA-binding response OmpR family regulator
MKVLIADDDAGMRLLLTNLLTNWGYSVTAASDGRAAIDLLSEHGDISIVILDWMMPEIDGIEICRRYRDASMARPLYIILLTGKSEKADLVTGLDAGADDYLVKPFNVGELSARLRVGRRIVDLQLELAARVVELETALAQNKQLRDLLPICSYCKRIRDDQEYWHDVDAYLQHHVDAHFSHGICPTCYESIVQPELERFYQKRDAKSRDGQPE